MSEDMKVAKDSIDESTVEGVRSLEADKYKYGFDSDIEQEFAPKGLNEDICLLYTSPSPRDGLLSRMPSSA